MVLQVTPTGSPADLADLGYDGSTWDRPWNLARGQLTTLERMPSALLSPGGPAVDLPRGAELDLEAGTFTDPLGGRPMTAAQLLDMAAGLDTEEHYEHADSMYWRYADAVGY